MYVLFAIADVKLLKLEQLEHCATVSTHTLMSEVVAVSCTVTPPSKNLVAKPIRLPVKLIVEPVVQTKDEQLQVLAVEPSPRVNQMSHSLLDDPAFKITSVTFFVILVENIDPDTVPYMCTMLGSPQQSEE